MPKQPSESAASESHPNSPMPLTPALLQQALNSVPSAVYVKNRQHQWLFANTACCDLLQRSPAELINVPESAVLSLSVAQRLQQQDEAVFQGQPSTVEVFAFGDSCEVCRTLTRRTELADDGNSLLCFLEEGPLMASPACLEDSSLWNLSQFNSLLANVPAMLYQLFQRPDDQLRFVFVSPSAFEVFGVSSEIIQANPDLILMNIHPLDRPSFEATLTVSANTLTLWRWEGRYYKPSGELRWLQTAARPQMLHNGIVMWDGLLLDITSRKQVEAATIEQAVMEQALADNEARFRTIAATIPGALFQLRVQGEKWSIDYISDRVQDITGLAPEAIMKNAQCFLERIHPFDRDRLSIIVNSASSEMNSWQFEGRIVTSSGNVRWWHADAVPLQQPGDGTVFCGVMLDITERKMIEEAYQENERRLRMALNVSGMGVWTWDMAADNMAWTTEPTTLFGSIAVSCCDTFTAYLQNVHPDDRAFLRRTVGQALEQRRDYNVEYRILLGDNTIRWVGERGGPWREQDGIVIGLAATVVDITDRKNADAALRESEERYRTLLENVPGAVYRCRADKDWTLLFQSEAIADITGYPVDHPIHRDNWRLIHPDDREQVERDVATAIIQRHSFELEYRILHADGSIRWVQNTGQPIINATETIQLIDGVLTDITRRKESEARFRELAQREALINSISTQIRESLELMPILQTTVQVVRTQLATDRVVVYRFGHNWIGEVVVEDVADAWQSTLGEVGIDNCFPSGHADYYESGRVRAIDDIYQAGFNDCHVEYLERLQVKASLIVPILLKKKLWGLLIAHECSKFRYWTGGEIELLISLAGQAGIAIGQADLYRQATENALHARQQAENLEATLAELQHTQTQLVQTEKMSSLGQLVAGVAHEINNPVSFINGNISHAWEYTRDLLELIELYQGTYPVPPQQVTNLIQKIDLDFLAEDFPKLLESMRIGAERIKSIVNSLRTFSRTDEADIKAVDIHEGLESTLMILQHRLKANGHRPEVELRRFYGSLPFVECYAGKLNQVFMNLISNAIDALEEQMDTGSQQRPPEICIMTERITLNQVRVTIADNGPGIQEAVKQRIFEPFYTTKPIGKGTGIGLSISYQVVTEQHHGTLECESQLGQGSAFHITIPLQQGTT